VFATSAFSALPLSTLSGSLFGSSVAEAAAGNDNTSMGFAISLIVAEGLSTSDQVGSLASFTALTSENPSLVDALFPVGTYTHTVFDQASVSQLRYLGGGFSAGAMSSGPYSGLGDELAVVSGDLFLAQTTVSSVLVDSAVAFDTIISQGESFILVGDGASGLDAPLGNINFARTFSDAATQADFIFGNTEFVTSFVDAASGLDIVSSIPTYPATFIDAATADDVISSLYTVNSTASDAAVIQDAVPTNIVGNLTVINSASYTDFATSTVVFQTNVVDSAHTLDQFSARLQWEPVPTDSPTVWTLINVFS
jgi:hypothetical protein